MAKIKHNNFLDTVVEVMSNAKEEGALHLYAEGNQFNGRHIKVKGKELFHFGTTGYLGLEQDSRLKESAIDAIRRYGTQFPLSKSYISHPLYSELEEKVQAIYQDHIIITKNSTLGHMAVIPSVVEDGDAVVLDHQVHWSVQNAVQPLKLRSVPVEMIRHNRLAMLEDKIRKLSSRCNKIWYMADGIYSMYGDYAPIKDLIALSVRYPQLHFYFDDVHGMSWKGKNGSGYVKSVLPDLPPNVILFGTLSKTFGASGAVMVCKDKKIHTKVKNFGGPLTFSAQLEPASVGAAIASASIHLSNEIYKLQEELADRINYFNECLRNTDLPLIAENDSPVFYIATGMPETGYNLVNRLIGEGFYVNLGIFPAVPVKNTGLRITISRHNQKKEIAGLVEALNYHHQKALEDSHTNLERVNFAFGRKDAIRLSKQVREENTQLSCQLFRSILDVDEVLWNSTIGVSSLLDWKGMKFLEEVFQDNQKPEHNYRFYYILVLDRNEQPVCVTFFTYCLWKEDMLAPVSVSLELEKLREKDPYHYTSYTLTMGSFLTEGDHLYLDRKFKDWGKALRLLLEKVEYLEDELKPNTLLLRDFDPADQELKSFFHNKGFVQVTMPETSKYEDLSWEGTAGYLQTLSSRSRRHFRKEIESYIEAFDVEVKTQLNSEEETKAFQLYLEVKKNNPALNTFNYPRKLFSEMNTSLNWEFILLRLKNHEYRPIVGVMFCYKNSNRVFVPDLIGMDYRFIRKYQVYRQLLYQTILRAKNIGSKRIDFGLTAAFEKRKVGAKVYTRCAYLQTRDNFALEALDWMRDG